MNTLLMQWLMHALEIIDALSFAYYNLIKVRCFYAKVKYRTLSLLLTKCILLEVGIYIPILDKSCEYPLYSWCYR